MFEIDAFVLHGSPIFEGSSTKKQFRTEADIAEIIEKIKATELELLDAIEANLAQGEEEID